MAKKKVDLDEDDFGEEVLDEEPLDEEEDFSEEEEEEPKPRGRNTGLTIFLCLLNVVAALAFTFLLVLDFQKRQEWSYVVFMNEFYIQGLPLMEEDNAPSASRVTMARQQLDANQLKAVANLRGVKGSGEFWAVDEPFPNRIQARHLTPEILRDYFGKDYVRNKDAEVATLEDEIRRLKDKVPADIAQVTKEAAALFKGKDDAAKRQFAGKLLLPLAYDIYQVEALDKKLQAAKGLELDALIEDAVQRRLLVDILAPCEIFRPSDVSKFFLEKVGDLDVFKLEEVKKLLQKRLDVAIADKFDGAVHMGPEWDGKERHSWEKRQTIGFLLVAIANLQKPDLTKPGQTIPMYPEAAPAGTPNLLRAQTVLGLYEFAAAAQNLPLAWNTLEERVIQSIHVDRQGFDIIFKDKGGKFKDLDGQATRNQAFIDKHDLEIRRILDLTVEIKKAEDTLKDKQDQNKTVKKFYEDRAEHLKASTKKLIDARKETAKQVDELRNLQLQLYRAQVELRDAGERNDRLLKQIIEGERQAKGLKGAKTP